MRKRERKEKACKYCGEAIPNANTYCDNTCQVEFQHKKYITEWKLGNKKGSKGKTLAISNHVRKYLRNRCENKCEMCGWNKVNPYTNMVPLEVDHIDGDASNCKEENLRMICPNCHSLTPTFRNTGGRKSARQR
jgi:hypothetical protein